MPIPNELGIDISAWRPGQEDIIQQIVLGLQEVDTVIVDAPPAVGKTVIAVAAASVLGLRTLFMTGTKALQKQYGDAPTSLPIVTGRDNHPCTYIVGVSAALGPCQWWSECPDRHGPCPYFQQRDFAIGAPMAVANYALVLSDPDGIFLEGRDLIIADECHMLEGLGAQYLGVEVDLEMAEKWSENPTPLPAETTSHAYRGWAEASYKALCEACDYQEGRVEERNGKIRSKGLEFIKRLSRLRDAVARLLNIDESWVPKISERDLEGRPKTLLFVPTDLAPLIQNHLWQPGVKRILMSGSIGDVDALATAT